MGVWLNLLRLQPFLFITLFLLSLPLFFSPLFPSSPVLQVSATRHAHSQNVQSHVRSPNPRSHHSHRHNITNGSSLRGRKAMGRCNLFQGRWIHDSISSPYYDYRSCPFINPEFDCLKYGRPDKQYLQYAWKPDDCSLPRFNGMQFLRRYRGKKIMFVGDSLSLNQWNSLTCMIHASVPNVKYTIVKRNLLYYVNFEGYNVMVLLYHTTYLVDMVKEPVGVVLKLQSIRAGDVWKDMDVLIFNSWHWWIHTGNSQPWDYLEDGGKLYKDMNRLTAFYKGLTTWANWVDHTVDPAKTRVFFQGISPTHYNGREWNDPSKSCSGQSDPLSGPTYPAGIPPEQEIVNKVISSIKKPVYLLDITTLSQLRKDAHPAAYSGGHPGTDCSHWCLPGLPDTWNQLLYTALTM